MPIVATDIKWFLSGGAGNSNPNASLGGIISTTEIVDDTDNNIFDDVTGAEASTGDTNYRGIYIKNDHGSLTWSTAVIWIESNTTSGDDTVDIALAGEGKDATMEVIADEDTAPVGETFSAPANKGAGLSLGNMAFSEKYGIWLRRTVNASASAISANTFQLKAEGDTPA